MRFVAQRGFYFESDVSIDDVSLSPKCFQDCSSKKPHPIIGTTDNSLSVTIEGDELVAQVGTNDTLHGGHVPLNTWAQIAVQQNDNKMTLYINGVEVNNSNVNVTIETNSSVLIGQNGGSSAKLKGWIDEIAVWSNVVNISNIYNKYQDPSSDLTLVLYLPFNEGLGNVATDFASSDNTTVDVTMTTWIASSLELSGEIPLPSSAEYLRVISQSQCTTT